MLRGDVVRRDSLQGTAVFDCTSRHRTELRAGQHMDSRWPTGPRQQDWPGH